MKTVTITTLEGINLNVIGNSPNVRNYIIKLSVMLKYRAKITLNKHTLCTCRYCVSLN